MRRDDRNHGRAERNEQRRDQQRHAVQSKAELRRQAAVQEMEKVGGFQMLKSLVVQTLADLDIIDNPQSSQGKIADADFKAKEKRFIGLRRNFYGDKQYSKLTQNLAGRILRMGPAVPDEIRHLAEDAVNGVGGHKENELREKLRAYQGIHKSGATRLKRAINSVRSSVTNAARVGMMFDLAQRGGITGAVAQADLIQTGADAANNITRNKSVQNVAVAVATKLGSDPGLGLRFLRSIGRIARLGGAFGTAAQIIAGVESERIKQRAAGYRAQSASYDAARDARVMDTAAGERNRIGAAVADERGLFTRLKDYLGFSQGTEEEKARRQGQYFKAIGNARGVVARMGVNATDKLAAYAAARGKTIGQLSEYERSQALNPAAKKELDRLRYSKEAEAYAQSQLDRRPLHERILDRTLIPVEKRARFDRFRDEFAMKSLAGQQTLQSAAAMDEAVARYRSTLSARDQLEITRATLDGIARQESYRNRHKVVWED